MDGDNNKKSVILLAVIGVATLLVAVVGATFAYFTVSSATGNANTTVTAKAEAVAAVSLNNPTGNLKLNVSASEMSQENQKLYYAVAGTDSSHNNTTTSTALPIARVSVGEGEGTENTAYTCTVDLTVSASGGMATALKEGEAKIVFSGAATGTIDLSSAKLLENNKVTATFNVDGKTTKTQDVNALVSLENNDQNQNHLAGQDLSVSITSGDFTCALKQ